MISWTVDEMLTEDVCVYYTREKLLELWGGRERVSLLDILQSSISDADKIWVCCRPKNVHRAAWLEGIVTRTVRTHALHCGIETVEEWAREWLSGADRPAAVATARAAYAADAYATDAAAGAYAYATDAAAVATDAADDAYDACAYAADATATATATAAAAAYTAERARQVQDMLNILGEETPDE